MTMIRDTFTFPQSIDWAHELEGGVEDYVWYFWNLAQVWCTKRYNWLVTRGDLRYTIDDLNTIATDALLEVARALGPRFASGEIPLDTSMFWHFYKQQIDWDMAAVQREFMHPVGAPLERKNDAGEYEEDPALIRTQLRERVDHSTLLAEIVDSIETMHPMEQFSLALSTFEEAKNPQIGELLHIGSTAASQRLVAARQRVLAHAMNRVSRNSYTVGTPRPAFVSHDDLAEAWTQNTYGIDLSAYVHAVAQLFRLDVFYVTRMLDQANGIVIKHRMDQSWRRTLTDEQVREIRHRADAGESWTSLGPDYGVSRSTIGNIMKGLIYADVA